MRRVQLAAAAIAAVLVAGALFAGRALAAQVELNSTFPASRIQVDPAPTTLNMPGPTTVTAIVVDWKGAGVPNVQVSFAITSGPSKGKGLASAKTSNTGRASVSYSNSGEPGIDAVQAIFSDGLEIHKSNRHFILWLSGPPATAIRSPATLTVTPNCFQPAATVKLGSNSLRTVAPKSTPKPAAKPSPPPPERATINVSGDNFNPFSPVLVTFDAGPGGSPQSFEAQTDPFGHFSRSIEVVEPAEGLHLVRADDFRQREADFPNYQIPCYQPSLALDPPIGPPGFVALAVGRGFPPNTPIALLNWDRPALPSSLTKTIVTNRDGAFQFPVLILHHDVLGPRTLRAKVANDKGEGAGAAFIEAEAPFFVTPGRSQPSEFVTRR